MVLSTDRGTEKNRLENIQNLHISICPEESGFLLSAGFQEG